ncbi:MAG: uracil-DNA glycosylase family protein [Anaerobacillus sp.]
MEVSPKYEEQYNVLAERYEVQGVVTPQTKLIFILESPHVAEVKNRVPVAGPSGATMSKKLFGEAYTKPLGLLLKKHMEEKMERPSLDVVGLLNVCNVPMQKKPYAPADADAANDLLDSFETIRTSNHKPQFKDDKLNDVQQFILTKFQKRLVELTDREVTLVPCGKFAQKFFKLANVMSEKWTVVEDVPHPSYNSWSRERYQSSVNRVVEELNRHKL